MATVSKWTPFGVALNITATNGGVTRISATQYTVTINASWECYYSGNKTNYGMTASSGGSSKVLNAFGTKSAGSSGSFTGTYSISGNGSANKTITVTFKNYNNDNGDSATKTVSFNVTVPAWTSYTISYNANGGSNAPANQTKWKNQALTLSSTKPTRTGYSFKNWNTAANGSGTSYASGGSYTDNAAVTLYAQWTANTYTVKYNANGGSNAPGNQTKTYGVALTLSSTKPTRTNYTFKGWGTSASATTVAYAAGASYTANAAITLYAIWELSYQKPRIYNASVKRCVYTDDTNYTIQEDGTSAVIKFDYACDNTPTKIELSYKLASDSTWGMFYSDTSVTANSGTITTFIVNLSSDLSYDFEIRVLDVSADYTDGVDNAQIKTLSLYAMSFPVDVLAGGKGISFGKAAELENTAEFAYDAKFNNPVYGNVRGLNKLPEIQTGDDFNNYMKTGCWAVYQNAQAVNIANMPVNVAGVLEVSSSTGEGIRAAQWSYLRQKFTPYQVGYPTYERDIARGSDNVWNFYDWVATTLSSEISPFVYKEPKILWGGDLTSGMYMTGGHTANLLEPISKQKNGIVLAFCYYNGTSDTNWEFQTFFVPKQLVTLTTSRFEFTVSRGCFSVIGTKCLYIRDTYISGHDDNNATGTATATGITYSNNKFVLRYVFGV